MHGIIKYWNVDFKGIAIVPARNTAQRDADGSLCLAGELAQARRAGANRTKFRRVNRTMEAIMEITTRKEDNAVVVTVKGELDALSSPEFEKRLAELIAAGEKVFIGDFGELDYISSAGLRSILATSKKLRAKEGQLLLSTLKDVVNKVFVLSGFSSIIPVHVSVESALGQI